jgi:hypothetical protein
MTKHRGKGYAYVVLEGERGEGGGVRAVFGAATTEVPTRALRYAVKRAGDGAKTIPADGLLVGLWEKANGVDRVWIERWRVE